MARCALLGALGLGMLVGEASGHMNSAVNLAREGRRLENGEYESSNSKWQCETSEVGTWVNGYTAA